MTRRELVLKAISHQETDVAPYQIDLTSEALDCLVEFTEDDNYYKYIGNHIAMYNYNAHLRPIADREGYWCDDFGVIWNCNGADKDIGVIDKVTLPEPSLAGYVFPEIDEALIRKEME